MCPRDRSSVRSSPFKSVRDIRLLSGVLEVVGGVEEVTVGTYVPQLGDALVYVAQGHYERMQEMSETAGRSAVANADLDEIREAVRCRRSPSSSPRRRLRRNVCSN